MTGILGRALGSLGRRAESLVHWSKEHEYWSECMREWYSQKFGLALDPIQSDTSSVPGRRVVTQIQRRDKSRPVVFLATGKRIVMYYLRELDRHGFLVTDFERILDFGVGFGRLIRHYYPLPAALHGCDITAGAVEFSRGCYADRVVIAQSSATPPLPYEDEYFDYIYANSVFTHIQTDQLNVWIDELARVARPGACVIVSVFSATPYMKHLPEREMDRVERGTGFTEWGSPHVRQRLLYATWDTLREWWGRRFDVLEVCPHFKDQDHLVLLRRP